MLALACVLALSGCGGSDENFNRGEVSRAVDALDSIENFVADGRCDAARRRSNALAIQSTHVSEDRPELGEAYARSVAHLQRLITRDCVEISADGPTPAVTEPTGPTPRTERDEPTRPTDDNDNEPTPEEPRPTPDDPGAGDTEPGSGGGQQQAPDNSGGAAPGA